MNGRILLVWVAARGTPKPNAFMCENPGGGRRQRCCAELSKSLDATDVGADDWFDCCCCSFSISSAKPFCVSKNGSKSEIRNSIISDLATAMSKCQFVDSPNSSSIEVVCDGCGCCGCWCGCWKKLCKRLFCGLLFEWNRFTLFRHCCCCCCCCICDAFIPSWVFAKRNFWNWLPSKSAGEKSNKPNQLSSSDWSNRRRTYCLMNSVGPNIVNWVVWHPSAAIDQSNSIHSFDPTWIVAVAAMQIAVAAAVVAADFCGNRRISIDYLRILDGQGHYCLMNVNCFGALAAVFSDYVDSVFAVLIDWIDSVRCWDCRRSPFHCLLE